jgi:outer membrane protein insertion porin family
VLQTKSTIGEVLIDGAKLIKPSKIRKELTIKPGQILNEAAVETDRQKILSMYTDKNYTNTTVQTKVDTDDKTGKASVTFLVTEGGKTVIHAIHFAGNTVFKEKVLIKQMKTRPNNLLSYFTKTGRVDEDQIQQDILAVREFYQNAGYIDVQVSQPEEKPLGHGKVDLDFTVTEGTQYHVKDLSVEGTQALSDADVRKAITTVPGTVFSPKAMRDDSKKVQDLYGARGYVDMDVSPQTTPAGPGLISVDYKITEGVQSYVEKVNITGNTHTKDKVIRRELAVGPGDIYNTVLVDASKQRLDGLNYFSRIDTYPSDTGVPGRKDLNVQVEEKRTGSFNFGAGFSSVDSIVGFVELQQTNFDLFHWPDFTGAGQRFRARIQYGTQRKDVILSLTEPYFLDYRLAVGGELFYRDLDFVSNYYNQSDIGGDVFVRKSINSFTYASLTYRLEQIGINNLSSSASDQIAAEAGKKMKSSLTALLDNDTRDSIFLTRTGHRVDFSVGVAGGPFGGAVKDYTIDLEGSQYFHLPWDTILLFNGEVATVDGFSGSSDVPIFDRQFLGGGNDLRGFDYRAVGPKDHYGEPLGGKTMARLTAEYTFPIVDKVRGAFFYDAGIVNAGAYDFSFNDINSDVGIGLRVDLPIGPVRIDYGIPLQSDHFNKSGGKFNFNIGYQF